ncbi:MAG TPA: Uma2 family endonuclease [Pirellulales bacterium]|jgi:Uma2 family endonuclease|nr:Uma2 family endonuclease [Pirellulales bacterium]
MATVTRLSGDRDSNGAIAVARRSVRSHSVHPPLCNGDRLTQAEFHRRYEQYPDDVKLELINGTVYMASPQGLPHGTHELNLSGLLMLYKSETPGVEGAHTVTVILADDSEPQPDLMLRISWEYGGQSRNQDKYVAGAPELIVEVAHSSVAIDLHAKKDDYQRTGVPEYIVVCIEEQQVRWFDLRGNREHTLRAGGILRSKTFPGFWLDTAALFRADGKRLIAVLQQGLASGEHARFVRKFAVGRKRTPKKAQSKKGRQGED